MVTAANVPMCCEIAPDRVLLCKAVNSTHNPSLQSQQALLAKTSRTGPVTDTALVTAAPEHPQQSGNIHEGQQCNTSYIHQAVMSAVADLFLSRIEC